MWVSLCDYAQAHRLPNVSQADANFDDTDMSQPVSRRTSNNQSKNKRSTLRLLDEVDFSRFDGCQGVAVWHGIQEGTFSKLKETLCRHLRMEWIHRTLVEERHGALPSDR